MYSRYVSKLSLDNSLKDLKNNFVFSIISKVNSFIESFFIVLLIDIFIIFFDFNNFKIFKKLI